MAERPPTPPGRIAWHELSARDAAARLGSDPQRGLTAAEAERRLAEHGRNEPPQDEREPWWQEAFEALTEPLVLLLVAVGVLYALLGRVEDAITIFFVIVAFSTIETATEARAKRAIRSLAELAAPEATVLRDAEPGVVPAWALVPGDVVLLDAGRRVPADVRLLSATALLIDESTLTGEYAPAAKLATEIMAADTPLGDRVNLAFAGTMVTAGYGRGLVAETGAATELGRVAALARSATEPRTPLQRYLAQLAGWLLWLALGFSALIPLLDMALLGRPWRESVLEGLTLAFATIPEELPILVTIMLGLGAVRLARQHAITRHLAAAETLGSVTVVCTDKTGTLTENRMQVAEVFIGGTRRPLAGVLDEPSVRRLLTVGVLANGAQATEAEDGSPRFIGDPTDVALLAAAHDADVLGARQEVAILAEVPFDDRRKRVSALYERAGERRLAVKGAPEQVLECCARTLADGAEALLDAILRAKILHAARQLAAKGERVIAFADGRLTAPADFSGSSSERLPFGDSGLTLIGLAGLEDPPRPEARGTVETLGRAGVRVVMLTGDHPATACAIAERVGLSGRAVVTGGELDVMQPAELRDALGRADVFARIAPEHKLRVVEILQEDGEVVAVIGDGINDAPALRRAAIGIAMGRKGTDVAREAADLVLSDDHFATVAVAVHSGRVLFENLRKAVRYYLAAKIGLVTSSLVAVLAHLPLPFAPVQIIILELFMDLCASTTFTVEPAEGDVMARPPRDPRRRFMDSSMVLGMLAGGLSLAAAVLVPYTWALRHGPDLVTARSAAVAAWLIGHVVLALHMRSEREPLTVRGLRLTLPFAVWAASAAALAAGGALTPLISRRLYLVPLPADMWGVVLASAILLPSWWEAAKIGRWRLRPQRRIQR